MKKLTRIQLTGLDLNEPAPTPAPAPQKKIEYDIEQKTWTETPITQEDFDYYKSQYFAAESNLQDVCHQMYLMHQENNYLSEKLIEVKDEYDELNKEFLEFKTIASLLLEKERNHLAKELIELKDQYMELKRLYRVQNIETKYLGEKLTETDYLLEMEKLKTNAPLVNPMKK